MKAVEEAEVEETSVGAEVLEKTVDEAVFIAKVVGKAVVTAFELAAGAVDTEAAFDGVTDALDAVLVVEEFVVAAAVVAAAVVAAAVVEEIVVTDAAVEAAVGALVIADDVGANVVGGAVVVTEGQVPSILLPAGGGENKG